MSRQEKIECVSIEAGADLSTKQFYFVVTASDGQVDPVASNGGDADGVLQNQPDAAGRAASVAVSGIVKVVAAGAVTQGQKVSATALGKAQTAASGHHVLGRAMSSTTADLQLVEVLLDSSHHLLA